MAPADPSHPPPPPGAAAHPCWRRLRDFDFDASVAGPTRCSAPARSFSGRLGGERGWSPEFTARVLEEYRRFLFLATVCDRAVCPSEAVDAAWHLHLIHSRSYWGDLCDGVLAAPLHHDASAGGAAEGRRHRAMYRRTLAAYASWFGATPPSDIWPPAWRRFDAAGVERTVDLRDHWVIRRPRGWPTRRRLAPAAATAPLLLLVPVVSAGLGPLDFTGPEFLMFFGGSWLALFVATLFWRSLHRGGEPADTRELTPEEVACLAHGPNRAIRATIAGMLHGGELGIESRSRWSDTAKNLHLESAAAEPVLDGDIAAAVRGVCAAGGTSLAEVERDPSVTQAAEGVRQRLQSLGWLIDDARVAQARWLPVAAFGGLLLLGLAKIAVGLSRERPVEFLVLFCIATAFTILWAWRPSRQTRAGEALTATLQAQHRTAPTESATDLALVAGLFGAVALTDARLEPYRKVWQADAPSGGSGGCGSGCGGGAGGCGGGGDGGGGCGGCGGGGD